MKKKLGNCILGLVVGTGAGFPGLLITNASKSSILGCVYTLLFGLLVLGIVRKERKDQERYLIQ